MNSSDKILVPGLAVFSALFFGKIYRVWPGGSLGVMLGRMTVGWVATWVLLIVLLAMSKNMESFSRLWLVTVLGLTTVTLWAGRALSFAIMARMRRAGYMHKWAALYGDIKTINTLRQRIENATWSGYDIVTTVQHGDKTDLAALDAELRGETDTLDKLEGRVKYDIYYLENWSLWMDLKIIFMTPLATLQNKNVY